MTTTSWREEHPKAQILRELARTDEWELLYEATRMADARDFDGLHAVLDALESTETLGSVFTENRSTKKAVTRTFEQNVSYVDVFAEALDPRCAGFSNWNPIERNLYRRLAPLVAPTRIGPKLTQRLMHQVRDGAFLHTLAWDDLFPTEKTFGWALAAGNGYVADALQEALSDRQFASIMRDNSLLYMGRHQTMEQMQSNFLNTYRVNPEGREAVHRLIDAVESRTEDVHAIALRLNILNAYMDDRRRNQKPIDMDTVLLLAKATGDSLEDTFLEELAHGPRIHGDTRLTYEPISILAKAAAETHCVPLLEATWPLVSKIKPLELALSTACLADPSAFQDTIRFLDKAMPSEFEDGKFAAPLHALAKMARPPLHDEEMLQLLLQMGADLTAKDDDGKFAFERIPNEYAERRSRWQSMTKSQGARRQIDGLLTSLSDATPSGTTTF